MTPLVLSAPSRRASSATVSPRSAPWWAPLFVIAASATLVSALALSGGLSVQRFTGLWWTVTLALHIPFAIILLFLSAGIVERVGYLVRGRRHEISGLLPPLAPRVCVQLPMFNETAVAARAIAAAGALRWPRDRFEVQILDDSTDLRAQRAVDDAAAHLASTGVRCTVLRRIDRAGYKAGALEAGRRCTDADFLLILDADFVAAPSTLADVIPYFYDADGLLIDDLALVQMRWGHLNRQESPLTEAQTLWVDDHHTLQMSWRSAQWGFVNFTGTAGVWRADAIEDAGGWRAASLVEDCELSFRALFSGRQTRFVKEIVIPAELPADSRAYRAQQKRWTQGWAQVQRLHLVTLARDYRTDGLRRAHLLYHMTIPCQWPLWGLWMLLLPILVSEGFWFGAVDAGAGIAVYVAPMLVWLALAAGLATVETARLDRDRSAGILTRGLLRVLPYAAVNTGMLPHQVAAYVEGLRGPMHSEFVRTPKTASLGIGPSSARRPVGWRWAPVVTAMEAFFVAYQVGWAVAFAVAGLTWPMLLAAAIALCVTVLAIRGARVRR